MKNITLDLSNDDWKLLFNLCGRYNITVSQLLENFIGDLIDGRCSNGSDERMYARQWFERCWFGLYPETTLLNWLLDSIYDVSEFLDEYDYFKEYGDGEMAEIKADFMADCPDADWEKEVAAVRAWIEERDKFVGSPG